MNVHRIAVVAAVVLICSGLRGYAADIVVTNEAQLNAALNSADDGDRILLAPGIYSGGFFKSGLTGVIIRSQFTANPAVISGGNNAFQLSDATRVTLEHLICQGQTGNGLNIDDGGSFATPSTDIIIRNLIVRDMNAGGNNDGIKLSGVTGFLIENVQIINWGAGGSAVDPVGSHHGLIQNSLFRHDSIGATGSGIRPKGGSKDIIVRANRVELPGTNGRAIQAGGSTGSQFFRFIDGDSGYEADEIRVEGNVVVNGSAPFAFVNIDGGLFHHNYAWRPDDWFIRILNENQGDLIVDTQNGVLSGNVMVFNDTPSEFNSAINIGSETEPQTFSFLMNQWYNIANPGNSQPNLPSTEIGGIYGVPPAYDVDEAIGWQFAWGTWIVNANESANSFAVSAPELFREAIPGADATFDPLLANPFSGDWTYQSLQSGSIIMPSFAQGYLVPADWFVAPEAQKLLDGLVTAGQTGDVAESNNVYLELDPSPTINLLKQRVDLLFQSTSTTETPTSLAFRLESKMTGGPAGDVIQEISLLNYQTAQWEFVSIGPAATTDSLVQTDVGANPGRFVQAVSGEITARVRWASESFSGTPFPWSIDIDEATWLIMQ